MSLRDLFDSRQLQKSYDALSERHTTLADQHDALHRDLALLLRRNQQQEAMIQAADTMYQQTAGALNKVQTLMQRHLDAGEQHVPVRALWHVLHEAGFTAAPKPTMDHALHVALKQAPELERKNQQSQAQKPQQQPEQKSEQKREQKVEQKTEQKSEQKRSQHRGMSR
jgi:hypothetical protein